MAGHTPLRRHASHGAFLLQQLLSQCCCSGAIKSEEALHFQTVLMLSGQAALRAAKQQSHPFSLVFPALRCTGQGESAGVT
eukprot:2061-Heterococcus_DN1.PRE.1